MSAMMIAVLALLCSGGALVIYVQRRQAASRAGQALLTVTEMGDLAQMRTLLTQRADLNARNAHGLTPLHVAAAGGDPAVVELLLQHGADVHAQSHTGYTPLYTATAFSGKKAVVDLLLAHGARAEDGRDAVL